MTTTLATLAELVSGQLTRPELARRSSSEPRRSPMPVRRISRCSIILKKPIDLARSQAGAVVVPTGFVPDHPPAIQAADVHQAFAKIVAHFRPARTAARIGVSPQAVVSSTAQLDAGVDVHPGATIGDDVESVRVRQFMPRAYRRGLQAGRRRDGLSQRCAL